MALWNVSGRVVNDADEGARIPEHAIRLPEYTLSYQYDRPVQWEPWQGGDTPQGVTNTAPGYISQLLAWADASEAGTLKPYEQEQWEQLQSQARAVPLRDVSGAYGGWGARPDDPTAQRLLNVNSPDIGNFMLTVREKMKNGTATPQERALFQDTARSAADWDYRASAPQESDANPFSLGDNLFGALFTLGLGATGGLAGGALAAGAGGLGSTLGSLGSLAGTTGSIGSLIGGATDQPWLANLGKYLGAAGGIAGGVGGLTNLFGTGASGVQSLGDAARLAQSAGRITGGLGTASGVPVLQQAGRYLGQAGQLGQGAADWLGWSGSTAPLAANVAPGVGGVQNLLSAADVATQRGGGGMDMDYSGWGFEDTRPLDTFLGWGGDETQQPWYDWASQASADDPAMAQFLGWGGDETQQGWYQGADLDTSGGGGSLWSTLGGLASGAGRLLFGGGGSGGGAGIGGPLLSALGSIGGGAIGSNAANEAARLQSQALNRGIDLQTAQWLQQQQNLAPYLQAGQQGLSTLQGLAGREQPGLPPASTQVQRSWYDAQMPETRPGWTPQDYQGPGAPQAGDYRWTPGQGPQAQDYRYTPGQTPDAGAYRYTPGAVPTLSGQELLANDPGVAFRMAEGRKALEASAAARGGLLSGPTLAALQRQGQELSSQEYGQAWNRASQQAQLREGWAQTASQLGFGQAEAASRLREQVNQIASQQGWSQAQAEAAFREGMAQQASQQGWTQALQGQQNQFGQGLQAQQWNQQQAQEWQAEQYKRMLEQNQLMYGRDFAENAANYGRNQTAYRQQLAQYMLPWEQASTLATLGGQATGMYGQQSQNATSAIANLLGQQGTAQAVGTLGSANAWGNTINSGVASLQNVLRGLNA